MIIPLHLLPEGVIDFGDATSYTLGGQEVEAHLRPSSQVELASPIAGPVSVVDLLRLQVSMAAIGLELQVPRMLYDRHYACEKLALAYVKGGAALRDLALDLYDGYERAGEWIGLIH